MYGSVKKILHAATLREKFCWSNSKSLPVMLYWYQANQSEHWRHITRRLVGKHWRYITRRPVGKRWRHITRRLVGKHWRHITRRLVGKHWRHITRRLVGKPVEYQFSNHRYDPVRDLNHSLQHTRKATEPLGRSRTRSMLTVFPMIWEEQRIVHLIWFKQSSPIVISAFQNAQLHQSMLKFAEHLPCRL